MMSMCISFPQYLSCKPRLFAYAKINNDQMHIHCTADLLLFSNLQSLNTLNLELDNPSHFPGSYRQISIKLGQKHLKSVSHDAAHFCTRTGVGIYLLEAMCSFKYSPPFSSYSALEVQEVVKVGDKTHFLAPSQASREGLAEIHTDTENILK